MSIQKHFGSASRAFIHSEPGAALVLLLLALAVRLIYPNLYRFDGLYGQDAYAYYNYARELFNALTHFQTPPPFWWPLGYPVLLSVAFLIGGTNIAAAQLLTILSGALVAPLAFALAVESSPSCKDKIAGWVAGLLCALGGQLVQSSIVIMADAPAVMWATLGSWLVLRYARTGRVFELCIASFGVGMAVWTRWQYLIFAFVWLVALGAIQYKIASAPETKNAPGRALNWLPLLYAFVIIAVVLSPQLLLPSATSAPLAGSAWLEGWHPTNFFARAFDTVDGHFDYALPVALFYGQVALHPAYLIALLTPMLVIGVITLIRRAGISLAVAILLLGWTAAMYLFLAGIPYENFRFSLGLFVPLCVITGLGSGWMWQTWRASQLRWALVAWIGVALCLMLWWQPRVIGPVLAIKSAEYVQIHALTTQVPPDALIWTLGFTGPIETYTNLRARNLWHVSPDEIIKSAPAYLLIDVQNIETQWRDREPYQLYQSLSQSNVLVEQIRSQNWTLFRINQDFD